MTASVAVKAATASHTGRKSKLTQGVALSVWALIGIGAVVHHEPWADEAHSWLLARDASLTLLWTHLLHYEGTPGLWQTLLHAAIAAGVSYGALGLISLAAAFAAAFLAIAFSPWPLAIRVALPFTYFLWYQYAVVARSYSLLPVLVFTCAIFFAEPKHRIPFTFAACLLAAVSLDGFILACLIYAAYLLRRPKTAAALGEAAVFAVIAALCTWSAWPARDNQFVTQLDLRPPHVRTYFLGMVQYAFTGEWITTIAAIAMSIPLLLRGRILVLFLALTVALCGIHSVLYMHVWHFGALTLAWLFCLWIAWDHPGSKSLAIAAFTLVIGFQTYWSIRTIVHDWRYPYSGSRAAAAYLKAHSEVLSGGLRFAGFSSDAVKAYFPSGGVPAYWDWSSQNRGDDALPVLRGDGTGYLLAGYKLPAERDRWAAVAALGGYRRIGRFEGNLYWRTEVLETESYDLYRRLDEPEGSRLRSSIELSDPSAAGQILSGFYDIEDRWRWTARRFSVALRAPALSHTSAARLSLRMYVPDTQIGDLGPLTVHASVDSHDLGAETISSAGDQTLAWDVPVSDFTRAISAVDFTFDKARAPKGAERRELAVMAQSIAVESK